MAVITAYITAILIWGMKEIVESKSTPIGVYKLDAVGEGNITMLSIIITICVYALKYIHITLLTIIVQWVSFLGCK